MRRAGLHGVAATLVCISAAPAFAQGLLSIAQPSDVVIENAPLTLEQDKFMTRLREIDTERFMRARGLITERGPRGIRYKPVGDWTQSDLDIFTRQYDQRILNGGTASSESFDTLETEFFWEQRSLDSGGDEGGEGGED